MRIKHKEDMLVSFGVLTALSFLLSLYFNYKAEYVEFNSWRYVFLVVSVISYLTVSVFCSASVGTTRDNGIYHQIRVCNTIGVIFFSICLKCVYPYVTDNTYGVLFIVLLFSATVIPQVVWLARKILLINSPISGSRRQIDVKKVLIFLSLCSLVICNSYFSRPYFMWDANLYFNYVDGYMPCYFFTIPRLAFANHISYAFSVACVLLSYLTGSAINGLILTGILLLLLGIYGYYRFLSVVFPSSKYMLIILTTCCYAFSPYVLGMSTYVYHDFVLICVFPFLAYCIYSQKWIYSFWAASFLCYTKETAVLTYGVFILALYCVECVKNRGLFHNIRRYLVLSLPIVTWLFFYFFVGHWQGVGKISFEVEYVKAKLSSLFLMNFNWLVLLGGIIGTIYCVKKKKDYLDVLIPIWSSMIGYLVFSLLFVTVAHPRYIDALLPQIFIIFAFFIMETIPSAFAIGLSGVVVILMFVSSFITLDPIMKRVNPVVNVGTREIVYINYVDSFLSDGWCYNRQYQDYGAVMDLAIRDIVDDTAEVYVPAYNGLNWYFNGMNKWRSLDNEKTESLVDEQNWNKKLATRMTSKSEEGTIPIKVISISNDYEFDLTQGGVAYYLYTDYAGRQLADEIKEKYIVTEDVFWHDGWKMYRLKLSCK